MRLLLSVMSGLLTLTLTLTVHAQSPIVQPGAPGEASRLLTAEQAIEVADTSYTVNDVRFMQDMIPHHQQALTMSQLAPARTNSTDILEISGRIEASQKRARSYLTTVEPFEGKNATAVQQEHSLVVSSNMIA